MKLYLKYVTILALFTSLVFFGCEKKVETPETKPETKVEAEQPKVEEPAVDTTESVIEEPVVQIPDLLGKWTGKFDSRPTVLEITKQTDSTFSGKITINYREVINQEVSGSISPSTMKINMKDLLHSRYQGKYFGSLSENGKTFSGTFTMDLDKSKFAFSLTKK